MNKDNYSGEKRKPSCDCAYEKLNNLNKEIDFFS